MKLVIGYVRVSTRKQGDSGLGLEAQIASVKSYARSSESTIVETYEEVESGRKSARPQLAAAIAACKRHNAVLVVAKLDRLSRNVVFLSSLMDGDVDFVCCDMPSATRLTVHILAAVAQNEAEAISQRTKAALCALKARGVKLGAPNATETIHAAREANSQAAKLWSGSVLVQAAKRRAAGRTLQEVADHLNGRGLTTRRGGKWNPTTISRLLATGVPSC